MLDALLLLFIARARDLFAQELSFNDWFEECQRDLDSLHRAAAAMAFGGFAQMQSDDHSLVEGFIFAQLAYFRNFAVLVYQDQLSEKKTAARSALYIAAAYSTYENSRAHREQKAGMLLYKRMTKPGNNCEECLEYALRGFQIIGALPGIGQECSCHSNCRCYFVFTNDASRLGKK